MRHYGSGMLSPRRRETNGKLTVVWIMESLSDNSTIFLTLPCSTTPRGHRIHPKSQLCFYLPHHHHHRQSSTSITPSYSHLPSHDSTRRTHISHHAFISINIFWSHSGFVNAHTIAIAFTRHLFLPYSCSALLYDISPSA